jgi:ubiquinone/menaquinone biosynthesis C-methylase UbiE
MTVPPGQQGLTGEDWAGEIGDNWAAGVNQFESMVSAIGDALLAHADFRAGERVLEIGPGGGATSLAIARTVGPSGEVRGIDISPTLVELARRRAVAAGAENLHFACADAARVTLPDAQFDRLFSRFGVMFFADPKAAFAHLRSLLRQGARIDMAVWAPPSDNPWMMRTMEVLRQHVDAPPPLPRAPGPFAFGDLKWLGEILRDTQFSAPDVVAYEGLQPVGGVGATAREALDFVVESMPVGRVLAGCPEQTREAAKRQLLELFSQHHAAGKGVLMPCKAWLITALAI